jgi:hypothetical protein
MTCSPVAACAVAATSPYYFWDPLGLSADKDEATFKRRRAVEIKHGRIVSFPSFQFWFLIARFVEFAG